MTIRIDLRLALFVTLGPFGDFGRVLAALREAEVLAVALDDRQRLGRVLLFQASCFTFIGHYAQAIAAAQHARARATASGDGVLHALAHFYLGAAYEVQGDYRQAIDCLGQSVASLEEARRHEHFGRALPLAVDAYAALARCHAELGTFAAGSTLGAEGVRLAEVMEHPRSLTMTSWQSGWLCLRQGDLSRALPLLERAVGLCQELDVLVFFPLIAAALGAAYTLDGRLAEAVPLLTQALEQATAMAQIRAQAHCRLALGEAHLLAGRLEEAHVVAEGVLAHTRAYQERGHEAYALRILGDIAARRASPERASAETHYRRALALAEELGMRPLQAHCHRGLGTLYTATGQPEQARTELSAAIALYRAMDMAFWLPQAAAALAQVEGQ